MTIRNLQKNQPNFYELALVLAAGQSHRREDRWDSFIDNLSRISDQFATFISPKLSPALPRACGDSPGCLP